MFKVGSSGNRCPLLADSVPCRLRPRARSTPRRAARGLHSAQAGCGSSEHSVAEVKEQQWTEKDGGQFFLLEQKLTQLNVVIPTRTIAPF